uniref:Uncharacterized protein n=1 Tax=Arundo donax TaxID=35708 RepID=A0A0A8YQJ1_ARUDO
MNNLPHPVNNRQHRKSREQ